MQSTSEAVVTPFARSDFAVRRCDSGAASRDGVRVTYLGTNGY